MKKYFTLDLYMHNNTNLTTDTTATTGNDLSPEMKTFYKTQLIRLVEPELVHNQFGQKRPIPKNGGKVIEFRRYKSLPKALTPLSEGVTPNGQKLDVTSFTATVHQYGGYVEISDMLLLTAIDNNLAEATRIIAAQAAATLDTVTREILNSGTNVLYAGGKEHRYSLVGGDSTAANNDYLKVDTIKRAVRALKVQNAKKPNGYYVAIIHPDCAYDLTNDTEWKYPHQYQDTKELYNGEIGMLAGVRFVESTEAKVFHADSLGGNATLTVNGAVSASTSIAFDGATTTVASNALAGRKLLIGNSSDGYQVVEATANTGSGITAKAAVTLKDNDVIYPGEAGALGRDVYSTLVIGEDAYGVTDIEGGGLEHIVKQLGSAGTADPLNQRATCGWKATATAEILVQQYMIRIESASTFNDIGAN